MNSSVRVKYSGMSVHEAKSRAELKDGVVGARLVNNQLQFQRWNLGSVAAHA